MNLWPSHPFSSSQSPHNFATLYIFPTVTKWLMSVLTPSTFAIRNCKCQDPDGMQYKDETKECCERQTIFGDMYYPGPNHQVCPSSSCPLVPLIKLNCKLVHKSVLVRWDSLR